MAPPTSSDQSGSARLAPHHDPDQSSDQSGPARLAPSHDPDQSVTPILTGTPRRQARRVASRSRTSRAENRTGWLFAAPTAILLLLLFVAPIVVVVVMAGSRWTLLGGAQGNNFPDNFTRLFDDPLLKQSIWFTVKYTALTTVILMPVALGLALLVQEARQWNNLLRTAILVPSALGIASASLLFYALYSPQVGPITHILEALGGPGGQSSVLGSPSGALWGTVILVVWRFAGFYMLLNMVGLQAIPNEVYEAAKLDGPGRWKTLTSITLPLLRPTIAMTMILSITGSLLAFDQFYILTKGGPNNSTMTVVQLIYRDAFETHKDLGMAAALSVLLLLALVVINTLQLRALRVGADEE
ncbi:carbohydrate ABC transporter permease [Rugosimonospora africana]|uniref:carbohydrate ABC transporter permease n=1 Tax=Rugosimonospora africana TaxID=556532 RepID=UPI0019458904|nr:sugar ABC transporter permease [Rugosimonospora africana]